MFDAIPVTPMIPMFALLIFPLLMALAALSDMFTMKISNKLVLSLGVSFFVVAFLSGMGLNEFLMHLASGGIVLLVAFTFFAFGWIGGGDAKFAAMSALWLGFEVLLPYAVYGALFGGALTLGILLTRRFALPNGMQKIEWIDRLHDPKTGIPYGIALATAGLIIYPETFIFAQLIA